ncbi:MAG TPA: hypothetical protein VFB62_24760 [Polyangiaceae bacterium]|jgi:hypothetical protein|nr:hypothetical protein [Polyangiaceae bacterium]
MREHFVIVLVCTACTAEVRGPSREETTVEAPVQISEPEQTKTPACPTSELYLADGCNEGTTCTYVYDDEYACITLNYTCEQGSWSLMEGDCNSPDCPLDKPPPDASCASEGMQCKYPGHYCPHLLSSAICDEGQWSLSEPECGNEPWNGGIGSPRKP